MGKIVYENKKEMIFYLFLALLSTVTIFINLLTLDKGFITSDEGWYYILLRDLPQLTGTQFHLLFKNVFRNNIYEIRVALFLIDVVSSFVFCVGLYTYYTCKYNKHSVMWILCFFVFVLLVPIPKILSYASLNLVVTKISVGLLLLGLFTTKLNNMFVALSGFMLFFLFPIMITNLIVLPFFIFLIFFYNQSPYKTTLLFLLGGLLFFIFYFSLIQSIVDYIENFISEVKTTIKRGSDDYGQIFLIKWLYRTCFQFFANIIIVVIVIWECICFGEKQKGGKRIMFYLISIVVFLLWCWANDFFYSPNWRGLNTNLMWIMLFLFMFTYKEKKEFVLPLFLIICVICLCFGSNVPFKIRNLEYHSLIMPIFFMILNQNKNWILKIFMLVTVTCYFINFINNTFWGVNWHNDKASEQTESFHSIHVNQDIYVDKSIINNTLFIRSVIPEGSKILCHRDFWGYVDVLGLTPIDYKFKYEEKIFDCIIKQDKFNLILPNNDDTKSLFLDTIPNISVFANKDIIIYRK